jgi:hypothetical protein
VTATAERTSRWWLEGDLECATCFGIYSIDLERRCTHCDAPQGPNCDFVLVERVTLLCRDCVETPS